MKTKRGFTLIELLIIVSIIGILAVAVIVGLSNARQRSKDTSIYSSLNTADKAVMVCAANRLVVANPAANVAVCSGMGTYTNIATGSSGWMYGNFSNLTPACTRNVSTAHTTGRFVICARNGTTTTNSTKGIRCTETGCVKIGF